MSQQKSGRLEQGRLLEMDGRLNFDCYSLGGSNLGLMTLIILPLLNQSL